MREDAPGIMGAIEPPPLALYIHTPWCVRKCPYCDFNSHAADRSPPFDRYVAQLLADLDMELRAPAARRPLSSIFIGGGTPSLFPGPAIRTLLDGIRARTRLAPEIEITLEANPGAADAHRFDAYRAAGVNRLSIGVQSLSDRQLARLGRIHRAADARAAVAAARAAGFENLNLDLMFALPDQTLHNAAADLDALIELAPEHVSYYQLTLESGTDFFAHPPALPDGDLAADLAAQGLERLSLSGYRQYEVSAYARAQRQCRHNLNYWRFGDYLGIGAGAHGKLTVSTEESAGWRIRRSVKNPHPQTYLEAPSELLAGSLFELTEQDCVCEFALNAMRLTQGFELGLFGQTTGRPIALIADLLGRAAADGLLILSANWIRPTPLGRDFLDDLVSRFLFHDSQADAG
ncbi:radical SAM family heme chaperone HemW [Thiocystis violascens]|uniref:Heme chaperone HemW n=1 Tax=Thiocystis violascens (strain ATCC 17096 / DSM 198 / 6111) TaxID=765911 RepID=I3YCP2_THIV6|nr:radical SAM family heme chaperone HemW [Thiocystis violascens]AFL74760.1 coproporphyrinogen III oxidase, anaerobic [Thiocystis violascens DSM 198]